MSTHRRLKPEVRKEHILRAALLLAKKHGYTHVTRDQVARAVGVTGQAIQYHFKTMTQFRRDLMRFAVAQKCLAVVAQGLALRDPRAQAAPLALREAAAATL